MRWPASRRGFSVAVAVLLLSMAVPGSAGAAALISTRPTRDPQSGDYVAFVGGIDENGRSLKVSAVEVLPSGEKTPWPTSTQSLSDWATVASEQNGTWRPPLAIGLVYLWVKGVPRGVLDGIHAFFQRVPSRTTVLPTVYGRMRQGRASLIAADISRLDEEVPPLDDYRPNLIEAVRLDLQDLATHAAPIKVLLLVTDGRDFADPKGLGPGDFAALGRDIRKAGVTALIVGYPPEADASQSAGNLRELHDAAGGFVRVLDQAEDLENTLESLGQAVGEVLRVQFPVPFTWRALGATRRTSLHLTTATGKRLNVDAGELAVPAAPAVRLGFIVGGVGLVGAMTLMALLLARRRRPAEEDDGPEDQSDDDSVLAAAHDLIRRGTSPERAAQELSRTFADALTDLIQLDPEVMNDPAFPYFRTRLGRQRLQQVRDLLVNRGTATPKLGAAVAGVLAEAVAQHTSADLAAATISARAAVDECTAFAAMRLEQLALALQSAGREHPVLATPRARGMAVAIQDALRVRGSNQPGIVVGWLVRSAGPGVRGETLRIPPPRAVLGSGAECDIRIVADPALAPQHLEIRLHDGDFFATPLRGSVAVEGRALQGRQVLSDGETLQVGSTMLVFKSARMGSLARISSARPATFPDR